jgi:hypothetical protein
MPKGIARFCCVSKKWLRHFFEWVFTPLCASLYAFGVQLDARSVQSVFLTYTPREKRSEFISRLRARNSCGGLFDSPRNRATPLGIARFYADTALSSLIS